MAKFVLPLLDAQPETQPYAAWLRSRLDYFEVAEQLRKQSPPTKSVPDQPPKPGLNPSSSAERKAWEQILSRRDRPAAAHALVPKLKSIFVAERVPEQLVWVAEVESGFNPRARSPAGAGGLFQLMPGTAKELGLRRWPFDQRYQVEPSAQGAARYLKRLHTQFGDWRLALAAYNAGPGKVQGLLERKQTRSFDGIATALPAETQMFVPKVEATILRREGVSLAKMPSSKK
jgi:membrane-bound lytic murein transglycosylase D